MKKSYLFSIIIIILAGGFFYLFQSNQAKANFSDSKSKVVNLEELQGNFGDSLQYTIDKKTNKVTFLKSQGGSIPITVANSSALNGVSVADSFMAEYGSLFGINNSTAELTVVKETTDELGMKHVRYGQHYGGVPVFGGEIIVHLNNNLTVASANGKAVPNISLDVNPQISSEEAIIKAKQLWLNQFNDDFSQVLKSSLSVFNKNLLNKNSENQNYLVWQIELYQPKPNRHEFYFIDAHSGDLVYQITGIKNAIDRRVYDCSYGDGWCYLDTLDWWTGYTLGRSEGQSARGTNPWYGLTDVDDLYTISSSSHNYFYNTFSRDGANNLGGLGDGTNSPSAKTDGWTYLDAVMDPGTCPNAFFDGYSINFCFGLVFTDIVAHEYGHGVVQFSVLDGSGNPAGLTYSYESGALNESYADIFGEAVEYYRDGSNDWLIGEDINVPGLVGPLRSMSDPASMSYPDRFYSPYYYCGDSDSGGVHTNSSVPNHAAYLMAMGGTFNNCTINAIGRAKEEAIFYRALTQYLTTSSGFNDAYTAILTSCQDLYGVGSTDCKEVEKALRAVEMNQGGYCSGQAAVDPGCALIDAAPTITSVSSNKANGRYKAGTVIDIDVTFSKAVNSSGSVKVTLETGSTDRSCYFTAINSSTGTCNYTVHSGDHSNDLNVKSISGTITDIYGATMTDFTPDTNLASNKSIRIDTTKPVTSISPSPAGIKPIGTKVKLTANESATIYYTTNGATPTTSSRHYSSQITLNEDKTIKYFAKDLAGNQETYHTASFTVIKPASVITVPGPGGGPQIRAFDYHGNVETPSSLYAFSSSFRGGAHVASCDVDNNGTDEIITGIGTGEEPWVKVFKKNGTLVTQFLAYSTSIKGGVYVACGDLDGNGRAEIITGVPEGFGPHIRVFDGRNGRVTITTGFFAYDQKVRSGTRVAAGDLNGDGKDEIIVGAGSGAGTQVRTFRSNGQAVFTPGFFVYGSSDRSGIKVAAGDVNGDGKDEIITGSGAGRSPEVKVYNRFGTLLKSITPYSASYTLGVKVAAGDIDGDGKDEIIVGTEVGGGPQVRVFKYSGTLMDDFFPYVASFRGGVDVAVGKLNN